MVLDAGRWMGDAYLASSISCVMGLSLKDSDLLAQGNALGELVGKIRRPVRAQSLFAIRSRESANMWDRFRKRNTGNETPAVEKPDCAGRSELHYAAGPALNVEKAKALIAIGADVNRQDRRGWTPLHFAAQANSVGMAELLLDSGADVDAVDENGNTPLFTAVFNSQGDGTLITLLRSRGASPTRENHHGSLQ